MLRQAGVVLTSAKLFLILIGDDIHLVSGPQFWEIVGSDQTELPGLFRSSHSNHVCSPMCVTFCLILTNSPAVHTVLTLVLISLIFQLGSEKWLTIL